MYKLRAFIELSCVYLFDPVFFRNLLTCISTLRGFSGSIRICVKPSNRLPFCEITYKNGSGKQLYWSSVERTMWKFYVFFIIRQQDDTEKERDRNV